MNSTKSTTLTTRSFVVVAVVAFVLGVTAIDAAPARFVNFESPHTRPLALSADGRSLFAVNTADNRLSVIDTVRLELSAEIPVGLEPVSVGVRPASSEVWVVNHLSDSVDVIDVRDQRVVRTIPVGDEPAAIAFKPDGSRAYVTLSASDRLAVLDAASKSLLTEVSLETLPTFNTQDPRGLDVDGTGSFVYVVPFESGNRTRGAEPTTANGLPRIVHDPELSDVDLFAIRTDDNTIAARVEGLGTILTSVRVSPDNTRIYVTGWDARNLTAGVERLGGRPTVNRLIILDRANLDVLARVDLDDTAAGARIPVPQPSDVAFDDRGRAWVAAQGANRVVAFDRDGRRVRVLPVGQAPRGLEADRLGRRLYVFNRLSHDVTVIDTAAVRVVETVGLGYDPTPPEVSEGRPSLYSARQSRDATQACTSCHPDGHLDNLVWDLGSPSDPKGPMVTQSLRGLRDNAPYHWRGERESLLDFNVAFVDLFEGRPLEAEDNRKLAAFLESIDYPPNPGLDRDGSLASDLARCGQELFLGTIPAHCPPVKAGETRQQFPCVGCHALPHGSNHRVFSKRALGTEADMEVTQLRGLYDRVAFLNDGRHRTIADLLATSPPFPPFPEVDRRAMQEFLLQFPTAEHHASVGTERTVNRERCPGGAVEPEIASTIVFLEGQAAAGNVDLTVAGRSIEHGRVHFLYDTASALYVPDETASAPVTLSALLQAACTGAANLTFTAWPAGVGARARDRDQDDIVNRDESRYGTDPAEPDTDGDSLNDGDELARATNPTAFDTDGDGTGDGQEVLDGTDPLDASSRLRFGAVEKTAGGVELVWTTVFGRRYEVSAHDATGPLRGNEVFAPLYLTSGAEDENPEGTERYVDSGGGPPRGSCRFYRVAALPPGP